MPDTLFMVYPSQTGEWHIQTVPVELGSFEDRKKLPAPWAGLSDKELQEVTGLEDGMFCHNGLFIAGCASFEIKKTDVIFIVSVFFVLNRLNFTLTLIISNHLNTTLVYTLKPCLLNQKVQNLGWIPLLFIFK